MDLSVWIHYLVCVYLRVLNEKHELSHKFAVKCLDKFRPVYNVTSAVATYCVDNIAVDWERPKTEIGLSQPLY